MDNFLKALRSGGGRIAVLTLLSIAMLVVGLTLIYNPPPTDNELSTAAAMALIGLIGGVFGALLVSLRGDKNNGNSQSKTNNEGGQ